MSVWIFSITARSEDNFMSDCEISPLCFIVTQRIVVVWWTMLHYAMCDPNYCADGCCDLYEVVKSVVTPLQSEDKTSLPTVFLSLTVTGWHGGCED